ncbi:amidase family protein, partial [Leucobacter ruminantium]
ISDTIGEVHGTRCDHRLNPPTVASGSAALSGLIANEDAATVAQLRAAGAVLLGKTNMPPMAAGGVQPGLYGYARSPYNPQYLTAAYGSGSSNGSATATTASMCAFGMAEETVSSGRSPASNNALVAYTPSRGMLSLRGNWPLRPTCDVVVPHTRSVADLLLVLDVLASDDAHRDGEFWRQQTAVELPSPSDVFRRPIARPRPARLDGIRVGVPKMYIGDDPDGDDPPVIRPSVRRLWETAADALRSLGAEIVDVAFPVVSNYEEDRPGARGLAARGLVPDDWRALEGSAVTALALDRFLRENNDPDLSSWAEVDGDAVFPLDDAPVPVWITRARGGFDWQRLVEIVKQGVPDSYADIPGLDHLLRGLEEARKLDFEDWLLAEGLDVVAFPAAGDVGRADLFERAESLDDASRNGVVYSNGNRVLRHLGIPTVTVPMGHMSDTQMPVGLTFAGPAYADDRLLDYASAYEHATRDRRPAFLAPTLPSNQIDGDDEIARTGPLEHSTTIERGERFWEVEIRVTDAVSARTHAWADGHLLLPAKGEPGVFRGRVSLSRPRVGDEMLIVIKRGRLRAVMSLVPLPRRE